MKKKYLIILSILIIAILSACGSTSGPTLTVEELQGTAAADAWVAVTLTQAAIPTATATATTVPPTATVFYTPQPTFTLVPTFVLPTAVSTESVCNQPPPVVSIGTLVPVKFVNASGGQVNLSFGMNSPNTYGECVTYSYALREFDAPVVKVLAGCYWAYAWIVGSAPSTAQTLELLCVNDPNREPDIVIGTEIIAFK